MVLQKTSPESLVPETKLYPPQTHASLLLREDLVDKLDQHRHCRLVLVSAPAGYGKSTVMADWYRDHRATATWVSLDGMDNDVLRFWTAFLQSVTTIAPNLTHSARSLLHFGGTDAVEAMLAAFLTEVKQYPQDVTVILDDFHVIHEPKIHISVDYLLRYAPENFHLAILSRATPPISIDHLRLRAQVFELNLNDLRFEPKQIECLFQSAVKVQLSDELINRISELTEGWISGVQLAILCLQDGRDSENLLRDFHGRNQFVSSFLSDKIFNSQTEEIQAFLLRTSVLDRMNSSLCRVVTENDGAGEILRHLVQTNAFTFALDHDQTWFRYHHLLSDFLRQRLTEQGGESASALHLRAAQWYESQGLIREATEHAMRSEDFTFIAGILHRHAATLLHGGELMTLENWFSRMPDTVFRDWPWVAILRAWVLGLTQHPEPALRLVAEVMQRLSANPLGQPVHDELSLELKVLRGYLAILQRHPKVAVESFTASVQSSQKYSRFFRTGLNLNTGGPFILRTRLGMRGYLRSAFEVYTALRKIWKHSGLAILGYGSAILGELHYEWNQLDELAYFIPRGIELGQTFQDVGIMVPMHLLHAKYLRARNLRREMWLVVEGLEQQVLISDLDGHWKAIVTAFKVRLWMEEGHVAQVRQWVARNSRRQHETVTSIAEFELTTLARALMYLKRFDAAAGLLSELLRFAEKEDCLAVRIEVLLLQARLFGVQGEEGHALGRMRRAIEWAMPEGYRRIFLDEGAFIAPWLHKFVESNDGKTDDEMAFVRSLLHGIDIETAEKKRGDFQTRKIPLQSEPLTTREQQILGLIEMGLSNADIANRLELSLGTVKGYTHQLYGKLGVKNRTHAAAKARELGLLTGE